MENKWKVCGNIFDGPIYSVYRTVDQGKPDEPGNRANFSHHYTNEEAKGEAANLNQGLVEAQKILRLPIDSIMPNPRNPRKTFDEGKLQELAQSIEEVGLLQPLVVESTGPGSYLLLAGERRLKACKMIGLADVTAIVRDRDAGLGTEGQVALMLIENLQREDLDPIEEARAFAALTRDHGWTQMDLAAKIGVSQSHIANRIRLLILPEAAQEAIMEGRLTVSAGKELATLAKVPAAREIIDEAVADEQDEQDVVWQARGHAFDTTKPLHGKDYPRPQFDTKGCQSCEHRVMLPGRYTGEAGLLPRCTDLKCWEGKQRAAEEMEAERARQQAIDAGTGDGGDGTLNLNELPIGSFERLGQYGVVFDQTECEECEHNRPAKYPYMDDPVRICLNPACFNAKRTKAQNARRQRVKELREAHEERLESLISSFYPQGLFDEDDDPDAPDHLAMVYIATQAVIDPPYSSSMSKAKVRAAVFERYGWDEPEGLGWDDEVRHLVGLLENLPASELVRLVFYAMLRPVEHDSVVFGAVYRGEGDA